MENQELILDERDPWDQIPDEPHLWFQRFEIYRLIGPNRSISKAYREWRLRDKGDQPPTNSGGYSGYWHRYAHQFEWQKRAQAWDAFINEQIEDKAFKVYSEGLSLSHERVDRLALIAAKLEEFILDPHTTRISPHVIEQYRGLLDDIARERGERQRETRITGTGGGPIVIETQWGRGGAASDAWKALPEPVIDTVVEEVTPDE